MAENNIPTLEELRPLVTDISKNVLDQVAPGESQMLNLFMDAYYKPIAPPSIGGTFAQNKDQPLGIGTPDLMAALVIPLVLAILTELAKEGVIPALKKRLEKKDPFTTKIEISQEKKITKVTVEAWVKDPKLAKKIIEAVNNAIASNL